MWQPRMRIERGRRSISELRGYCITSIIPFHLEHKVQVAKSKLSFLEGERGQEGRKKNPREVVEKEAMARP
jgi:hypothetical protein